MKEGYTEEKNIFQCVCVIAFMLIGLAYITMFVLLVTYGPIVHPSVRVCYKGREENSKDFDKIIIAFIGVPYDTVTFITILIDAMTYYWIKKKTLQVSNTEGNNLEAMSRRQEEHKTIHTNMQSITTLQQVNQTALKEDITINLNKNFQNVDKVNRPKQQQPTENAQETSHILDIPLKATIISTIAAIPGVVVAILLHVFSLSFTYERYITYLTILIVTSLRMPVILTITFRRNEMNQAIDRAAAREQKRQIEIYHPMQSRRGRQVGVEH